MGRRAGGAAAGAGTSAGAGVGTLHGGAPDEGDSHTEAPRSG